MVHKRRRGAAIVDTPKGILVVEDRGSFILPGGGANKGESREKAAIRELYEETGLMTVSSEYLFSYIGRIHKSHGGGHFQDYGKVFLVKTIGEPEAKHEVKSLAYWTEGSGIKLSPATKVVLDKYMNKDYDFVEVNEQLKKKEAKLQIIDQSLPNTELMRQLFRNRLINAHEWKELYIKHQSPKNVETDRVIGMVLGTAIGDALGNTSESKSVRERQRKFGFIENYLPNKHSHGERVGMPSDDTQLAFDTLEIFLEHKKLYIPALARIFASHKIHGIGRTTKGFLKNFRDRGVPWYKAGIARASNGALMRIAPAIIPNLLDRENYWADSVLDTMLTHNEPLAIASSAAFADLLWWFVTKDKEANLDPKEVIERFCFVVDALAGNRKHELKDQDTKKIENVATFIREQVTKALDDDLGVKDFATLVNSGASLIETVPCVLYIICKHMDNPTKAILEAVNYTKDNDTIASIVGAAMGALYGKRAFRRDWINGLSGRLIRRSDEKELFRRLDHLEKIMGK